MLVSLTANAQGVGIGTAGAPDASAAFEVKSTTKGGLLPRVTSAQRAAIANPVTGLMVFQTNFGRGVYYFDGNVWRNLTTGDLAATTATVTTLAGSTVGYLDATGTAARFNSPTGVACDGVNAFVADQSNHRIRQVVLATGVVTTLAGNSTFGFADGVGTAARFFLPYGVACAGGNVYVVDGQRVRLVR
ncbi:hypothetical protein JAO73_08170 [Hymenobacter sp. BT523]|uniref:hypothetical protein n=1 Tax=Hymenobacter sp. BT523 TaxID=2795725 RepID=UPI0018ED1638|nr:hypothetical protein [Hymenobacter sp. BT523]MBJ6108981.1 hypothetical protein [Hymenobacter sp. BT523]